MAWSLSDPSQALAYLHQAQAYRRLLDTDFGGDALRAAGILPTLDTHPVGVASVGNMRLDSQGRQRLKEQQDRDRQRSHDDAA